MFLSSLYLRNFRSHRELFWRFSPGINLIVGKNACGKTTVLEAISLLLFGRSFRSFHLKDVIAHGKSYFVVEASFQKCGIEQTIRFSFDGREKMVWHNNTKCESSAALLGLLQGTFFLPQDVNIVKGSPRHRRNFLDMQLAQIDPMYVRKLTRYYRAMKERNCLLKRKKIDTVSIYEEEMAKAAAYIVDKRKETIDDLERRSKNATLMLSGGREWLTMRYKASIFEKSGFFENYALSRFKSYRGRELERGYSLIGPHKDDVEFLLGGTDVKNFASEGQQKSVAFALKFAAWERSAALCDHKPLMLIDDFGIGFDKARKGAVLDRINDFKQVFITDTEEVDVEGGKLFSF